MSRFAPLQSRRDVWLDDLPFSNVDELGNRWIITDIDGWWDLPPMSMGEVDRAYSEDGSYYEPGRFSSRALRLTGRIIPPNNDGNSANLARKELNRRLMLVRKTGLLQVLESPELGGGKQAEVVVRARPLLKPEKLNGVIDFDLQFRAPDPRKYSVAMRTVEAFLTGSSTGSGRVYGLVYNRTYVGAQSNNTAKVLNEGDYNTYGTIRLHGPVDNPGAHHLESDRHIKFPNVRLGVGPYIDVNPGEKTIISESGISLRDRMDDGSRWFKFEEGENRISLLGTSYLEHVPGVEDITNIVTDPSFEGTSDVGTVRTVRSNHAPNPAGTTLQTSHDIRESMFSDPQAQNPEKFTGGTVSGGYVSSPSVFLVYAEGMRFPLGDANNHHFVQMQVKPVNSAVPTAKLNLAGRTSGPVPISSGAWTTIRVDSHIPLTDYDISLDLPGASAANRVQIRNIMVIRSTTPIAGDYPYWAPKAGVDNDGVETLEVADGEYLQTYSTPNVWSIVGNDESYLRIIETEDDETSGAYVIPKTTAPHIVSFGRATTYGEDITYGVVAEGITEIRLYDGDSGELLQTSVPSHLALNYISETPIRPRIEATIGVMTGSSATRRKISSVMITYDGGTKIFTDQTPNEDGYTYDYYSAASPARERITSFVTDAFTETYNNHAREVSHRAFDGSRSLEIVYHITPEDQEDVKATPVSRPDVDTSPDTYHARAKIMSNKPTNIEVAVEGVREPTYYTVAVNPNHWSDVSFPFDAQEGDTPYLTVTPSAGERALEVYVDTVGILTEDAPYFDGSTKGPYTWSGAPHASTSATIPVVGVPNPRMEIMYRNAWIG